MKKIFHSALGLITGLLLAGTVSAQEPNGTNRVSASHDTLSESSRQNPSSLNISNLGKLPVEPAATKRDSDKPSKWNSEGKMFLNMYRQSQQKGEDTKQLRKQLQDQFGMRSMGKTKSKKDYVPVFLSYNDPSALDDAKKLGFIPQTVLTDMCTGLLPVESATKIEAIPGIYRISASMKKKLLNDVSRELTKVNLAQENLWQENGLSQAYDGTGVVVGIVDMGFDYTHPTFYSNPNDPNTCRISRAWDQLGEGGSSPTSFAYGVEYASTEAILTAEHDALPDMYHATHVAGTAAGSGAGTEYRGVAPGSELVFVTITGAESNILDGVNYVYQYARSINKPCVINMSLGLNIGPHDGYSDFDVAADKLVNADPNGFLLVAAAGNEGDIPLHIEASLDAGESRSTAIDMNTPSAGLVDVWGDPGEDFVVVVFLTDKDGNVFEESAITFSTQQDVTQKFLSTDGGISDDIVTCFPSFNPYNGKKNLLIQFEATTALVRKYDVCLQFQPISDTSSAHLHAWINDGEFVKPSTSNTEWIESDTKYTHSGTIGTCRNVISVGAYYSRTSWENINGQAYNTSGAEEGDICYFSSRGPLLDGTIKPEITAPGSYLVSSYNSFSSSPDNRFLIERTSLNGKNYSWACSQGTSMATPVVTGIAAMLLQQNPYLSTADLRELLRETAIQDEFTGEEPDGTWGYGKIDALAALQSIEKDTIHTVNIEQTDGGQIVVLHGEDTVTSGERFPRGTVLTLRAIHAPLYTFEAWWDGNTQSERELIVARDENIKASFKAETVYTITITQSEGGTIIATYEGDTIESGAKIAEGSLLRLAATADEGYQFKEWWDGNTNAERNKVVSEDLHVEATFAPGTATEEIAANQTLVYPNPSDGVFRIECPNAESVQIFNTQGQLVRNIEEDLTSFSLDMKGQPSGIYYMHILYPEGTTVIKLIIR